MGYVMAASKQSAMPVGNDLYSVTELGKDLGVSARTIRFYEDKGLICPRRAGNNRVYGARDRARMILILRGKQLGFSLREIREYLDLYDVDPTHAKQTRLLLKAARCKILLLEKQRVALDQTLGELREVEAQAQCALSALENSARGGPRKSPQMNQPDKSIRINQSKDPAATTARISQE
jgi:DNA-binding transcriptional MerR regulator